MLLDFVCASGSPSAFPTYVNGAFLYRIACVDGAGEILASTELIASPVQVALSIPDPVGNFTDGHLLGWGVVAAMAVAWGIHVLRRGI